VAPLPAGTNTIISVITNTAEMTTGTNSTKKFVGQSFVYQSNTPPVTVEFDRNRLIDMAGQYNGLFSVDGTPSIDTCGAVQLTLSKTGTMTGKVVVKGVVNSLNVAHCGADGTFVTTTKGSPDPNTYTVAGTINWADSPNDTAKQISGVVSNASVWTATMLADKALPGILAANDQATMAIADASGTSEGGSAIGTIGFALGTSPKVKITLTVPDKTSKTGFKPAPISLDGTRSGNIPVYASYTDGTALGVIIGFLNGTNKDVTTNGSFAWMKTSGGNYYTAGFTNGSAGVMTSPYTSGLSAGNYQLTVGGGGQTDLTYTVNQGLAQVGALPTNSYSTTISSDGTVKVTYGTGVKATPKWQANGVILQNVNEVRGFLLNSKTTSTVSGKLTVDP
jgi:hypothetical protein